MAVILHWSAPYIVYIIYWIYDKLMLTLPFSRSQNSIQNIYKSAWQLTGARDTLCHWYTHQQKLPLLISWKIFRYDCKVGPTAYINPSSPSATDMRQRTGSVLVQICLFVAKPLPEPMLVYCQLDPCEHNSPKFESKYLKTSSVQWRPFCLGPNVLMLLCLIRLFLNRSTGNL